MEPNFSRVSGMINGFEYHDWNILPNPILDPSPDLGFHVYSSDGMDQSPNFPTDPYSNGLHPPSNSIWGPKQDQLSPSDENDSSNPLLKYVSQILMEEHIGDKPCMFYDSLALRQTEEMFQRVISNIKTESHSSHESTASIGRGSDLRSSDSNSSGNRGSFDAGNSADSVTASDPFDRFQFVSNLEVPGSNTLASLDNRPVESSMNEILIGNMFSDTESVLQFKKGVEEASKFLPSSDGLIMDLEPEKSFPAGERKEVPKAVVIKEENQILSDSSRVRKNHEREESEFEETRSHKQSAMHVEDRDLTEMFDKVLLLDANCDLTTTTYVERSSNGSGLRKTQAKKEGGRRKKKNETMDFRTLLVLCAQAISSGDKTTADDLLRRIKQGSSPLGDACQRLAHHFANALEVRLQGASGPGIQNYYNSITSKKVLAADIFKAYNVYLSATPFMTLIYFFANKMIVDTTKDASALHIVDFGILYGFQWPMFIQYISKREGGPPKLRITGIDLPQRGFRPAERIEETGKRLADYCRRFGVPFEFNAIASQNWETIRISDFKIRRNEVLAVNAGIRFKNLLDETAGEENCPRDAILRLIRDMDPNVFIHAVVNGSFNAPFFTSRFKEALFHYSSLFDMFDSTLPREDPERIRFEREFYGREAMNVIACEGVDRVERPETYRQWQVRMVRAGFKQKAVENELMEKFRAKLLRWGYHKDFVIDEDGDWFLQCWKGRILYASSCWVPA